MTAEQGKLLFKVFMDTMKLETETTKKVIRAVPEDKKSYKPDQKAKSADELAWHIATSEIWCLDLVVTGKPGVFETPAPPPTIDAILEWYQANHRDRVNKLEKLTADQLVTRISLGPMELPVVSYLNFLNLHTAHHRGQLATYLRPMGSKVPSIYGGSADEAYQP